MLKRLPMPKVRLYNIFRNRVGKPEVEMPAEEGMTLDGLLDALEAKTPGFRKLVLNDDGERPREGVAVMINGKTVLARNPLGTRIGPEDEVTFVPAIAGG